MPEVGAYLDSCVSCDFTSFRGVADIWQECPARDDHLGLYFNHRVDWLVALNHRPCPRNRFTELLVAGTRVTSHLSAIAGPKCLGPHGDREDLAILGWPLRAR